MINLTISYIWHIIQLLTTYTLLVAYYFLEFHLLFLKYNLTSSYSLRD